MATLKTRLVRLGASRWGRLRRSMTLGARALLIEDGRALFVRHGYTPGWHFPGGGVEPGETAAEACVRELREETGVVAVSAPELVGLYFNPAFGGRDHVALFRVEQFSIGSEPPAGREIAERRWFALDAPPAEATPATRRRLAELRGERTPNGRW